MSSYARGDVSGLRGRTVANAGQAPRDVGPAFLGELIGKLHRGSSNRCYDIFASITRGL